MTPIPSDKVGENLSCLIDHVPQSHEPVQILCNGVVAVCRMCSGTRLVK